VRYRIPILIWEDGCVLYRARSKRSSDNRATFQVDWPEDLIHWSGLEPNLVRQLFFWYRYIDEIGTDSDGWFKPLGRALERDYCRISARPDFAARMRAQAVDFAVATRLTRKPMSVLWRTAPNCDPDLLNVIDDTYAVGLRLYQGGRVPWRLTYDDEPFALLDLPGPALWPWEQLEEFAHQQGIAVQSTQPP
jgi:hypothetical protein